MDFNINNKTIIQVGIAVLIVVILLLFLKKISNIFNSIFGTNVEIDYPPTPPVEGEPPRTGFSPDPFVIRLKEVHQAWMLDAGPRCDAYRELMELNDNEFIEVVNKYYEAVGRSLRSDMDNTFQSGCNSLFAVQWDDRVRKRMDRLRING